MLMFFHMQNACSGRKLQHCCHVSAQIGTKNVEAPLWLPIPIYEDETEWGILKLDGVCTAGNYEGYSAKFL